MSVKQFLTWTCLPGNLIGGALAQWLGFLPGFMLMIVILIAVYMTIEWLNL